MPPLDYALVRRLKATHPDLEIILNGGIASLDQAQTELAALDGVMMGRAAYQEPWQLLNVDPVIFGEPAPFDSLKDAAAALMPYIERQLMSGVLLDFSVRFPARALSGGIWRLKPSSLAPVQPSSLMHSCLCWTGIPNWRTSPPDDFLPAA